MKRTAFRPALLSPSRAAIKLLPVLVVLCASAPAAHATLTCVLGGDNHLTVTGTSGDDSIRLGLDATGTNLLIDDRTNGAGTDFTFAFAPIVTIHVFTGAGDDLVVFDDTHLPGTFQACPRDVDVGDGDNAIVGSTGTLTPTQIDNVDGIISDLHLELGNTVPGLRQTADDLRRRAAELAATDGHALLQVAHSLVADAQVLIDSAQAQSMALDTELTPAGDALLAAANVVRLQVDSIRIVADGMADTSLTEFAPCGPIPSAFDARLQSDPRHQSNLAFAQGFKAKVDSLVCLAMTVAPSDSAFAERLADTLEVRIDEFVAALDDFDGDTQALFAATEAEFEILRAHLEDAADALLGRIEAVLIAGGDALVARAENEMMTGSDALLAQWDDLAMDADALHVDADLFVANMLTILSGIANGPLPAEPPSVRASGSSCTFTTTHTFTGLGIIIGTPGNDLLLGTPGVEFLFGGGGNDRIRGLGGLDVLMGWTGDDDLLGGDGYDLVFGNAGNDCIDGGEDSDLLFGNPGNDIMDGFRDQGLLDECTVVVIPVVNISFSLGDFMMGGDGSDTMTGSDCIDLMFGMPGLDPMSGKDGLDVMFGGDDDDDLNGGDGGGLSVNGNPVSPPVGNFQFGNAHADDVTGGSDIDFLWGNSGNDVVNGDDEIDLLFGNSGNDRLNGGEGIDLAFGFAGVDVLHGDDGELDLLFGNADADSVYGDGGPDLAFGNAAADRVHGGSGLVDLVFGNAEADVVSGDDGIDFVFGNDGDDRVNGNGGVVDFVLGNQGADTVHGDGGIDVVFGNPGADHVFGDDGVDFVFGNQDADDVHGGLHTDFVFGGGADDLLEGNDATDVLFGGAGLDEVHGNAGVDVLFGNDHNDTMYGEDQVDLLFGNAGNDRMYGGDGFDVLFGNGGYDRLFGEAGFDVLFGNSDNDEIDGGVDRDLIFGNGEHDVLKGGAGGDLMFGNSGQDCLEGGDSSDLLFGNSDADRLHGGGSADFVFGNGGDDGIDGGAAGDYLFGNGEVDAIHGGDGGEVAFGNLGNDRMYGNAGSDVLFGNRGADEMYGGDSRDWLFGNQDDDFIRGGSGSDLVWGGSGNDDTSGDGDPNPAPAAITACDPATGVLLGCKFEDVNSNGVRDEGEPTLPGWQISFTGPEAGVVATGANGCYEIRGLAPGVYTVCETPQSGWTQVFPSPGGCHTVKIGTGQTVGGLDFGNRRVPGTVAVPPWMWFHDTFTFNDVVSPGTAAFDTTAALVKTGLNIAPVTGTVSRFDVPGDTSVVAANGTSVRMDLVFRVLPGPGNYSNPGSSPATQILKKVPTAPTVIAGAVANSTNFWENYLFDRGARGAGTHPSPRWSPQVWNSARIDTAQSNLFQLHGRGVVTPADPSLFMSTYHEAELQNAHRRRLAIPRNICFVADTSLAMATTTVICGSGAVPLGVVYPPVWAFAPSSGRPSAGTGNPLSDPANLQIASCPGPAGTGLCQTIEGTKIIPDGLLTPGSHVQYFFRRENVGTPGFLMIPDTNLVLQPVEGSTDGHRWQQFSVLPDRWKESSYVHPVLGTAGLGTACMLYIDQDDGNGGERAWVGVADSIGATALAKRGAHNGWAADGDGADVNDPAYFVRRHIGSPGTTWDLYSVKASALPVVRAGSIGSRGGVSAFSFNDPANVQINGKTSRLGPRLDVLTTYYRTVMIQSGKTESGVLGPLADHSGHDVRILQQFLSAGGRGIVAGGDGFVQSGFGTTEGQDFMSNSLGVTLGSPSYEALSTNTLDAQIALQATNAVVPGTGHVYSVRADFAHQSLDVLGRSAALFAETADGMYYEPYGGNGPYVGAVTKSLDPAHPWIALTQGWDFQRMISRDCEPDPACSSTRGRLHYAFHSLNNVLGVICQITGPPISTIEAPAHRASADRELAVAGNPARAGMTTLHFGLATPQRVNLAVYDIVGRRLRVLADRNFEAGAHRVVWDGLDDDGRRLREGVYWVRLTGPGRATSVRQVVVLR